MTDLEITKRCAEAMGLSDIRPMCHVCDAMIQYEPLHDDAQAMALVKKIGLHIVYRAPHMDAWRVDKANKYATANDLNHAICLCVAKMGEAK